MNLQTLLEFWTDCRNRRREHVEKHRASLNLLDGALNRRFYTQRAFLQEAEDKLDHAEFMVAKLETLIERQKNA